VISGLRRDVDEICCLVEYYAKYVHNSVPTFRDKLSAPSSGVKDLLDCGTDGLFRNVGKELPLYAA